jgi:hypothetical protein
MPRGKESMGVTWRFLDLNELQRLPKVKLEQDDQSAAERPQRHCAF